MTHAEIIVEMRFHGQQNIDAEKDKPEYGILTVEGRIIQSYADRLETAHKRELDALDQRRTELNAEVAAKDAVIQRLNDAIAEEQRREMATTEKSSAVGDCAKLRETISTLRTALKEIRNDVLDMVMNHKSEDPDSYAHGLCLSIGGACDMALNSTKEFDDADK